LPDYAWAAKVVAYESAFLWVVCCLWGILVGSFILAEDWITQLIRHLIDPSFRLPLRTPVEVVVLLFGTAALGVLWLWRYRTALRAIRWSNF
jgi:hypothetical protein